MSSIPADATAFLATHGRAYLYVLDAAGRVRGWPMIARYADGALAMTSYRKAPKVPHLAAATRATVVVTSDEGSTPFRYAVVEGSLKLTDITPDMVDEVTRRMHGPASNNTSQLSNSDYSDDGTRAHFRARLMEGKRVLIEVGVASAPMYTMAEAS